MSTHIRQLDRADLPALRDLMAQHRYDSVFVASRVAQYGVELSGIGCQILGLFRANQLVSALHLGANLVPVGGDPEAMATFARHLGGRRAAMSIMGNAELVSVLYATLSRRWGRGWANARDYRPNQPVMLIETEPLGPLDTRVHTVEESSVESYFAAAIKMYTEEVGVSPLEPSNSYHSYVRSLLKDHRGFGAVDTTGQFWFKTDVGAVDGDLCQVQGVWLDPRLRGQGLSGPAFAQAVSLIRRRYPQVSLYVNDYNLPALSTYRRIGMRQVSTMATVLY
jgi:predicted GNAT family acetyltransferase